MADGLSATLASLTPTPRYANAASPVVAASPRCDLPLLTVLAIYVRSGVESRNFYRAAQSFLFGREPLDKISIVVALHCLFSRACAHLLSTMY